MTDPRARFLLHLDSAAGLSVGAAVLAFHPWLAGLYGLPVGLVLALGVANVVYGLGSGMLVWRLRTARSVSRLAVSVLAGANMAWGLLCFGLAAALADRASLLGLGSLVFEGVVVGGLGFIEWKLLRPHAD